LINILLSLICFAQNGLLITSCIGGKVSMEYCYDIAILAEGINEKFKKRMQQFSVYLCSFVSLLGPLI
jgi:hypothetical protein